jgi:hypothetical protein
MFDVCKYVSKMFVPWSAGIPHRIRLRAKSPGSRFATPRAKVEATHDSRTSAATSLAAVPPFPAILLLFIMHGISSSCGLKKKKEVTGCTP